MTADVYALVGATGGAGTTRLTLEFAATLARAGKDVAVADAAFGTQGMATATPGRVDPDVTRVVTEDRPLGEAATVLDLAVPGRVTAFPARASFERLSRAMTSVCAQRFAERLSTAAGAYDAVLVDVPPLAANQAVAAVTAAERVAVVVPDTERGADALVRTRDRLADVDASADAVVANFADPEDAHVSEADAAVPESGTTALPDAPVAVDPDEFAASVARAVESVADVQFDLPEPESSSLTDYLPG